MGNKYYIRVDTNNNVVYAFSDAFESSQDGDICVDENGERHFNPQLFDMNKIANYKWNGTAMVERSTEDKAPELALLEKVKQKQAILDRLAELDREVPRIVEDMLTQGNFTIYPAKQAIINEKQTLREQLKTL